MKVIRIRKKGYRSGNELKNSFKKYNRECEKCFSIMPETKKEVTAVKDRIRKTIVPKVRAREVAPTKTVIVDGKIISLRSIVIKP